MTPAAQAMHVLPADGADVIEYLRLDELDPSPLNPRKTLDPAKVAELAESIREHGFLVPLLIRSVPIEGDVVAYHIIAGRRRAAAGKIAGKMEAPCIVREMTDDEARELAIVDNLQRADVEPLEEAESFSELLGRLLTVAAVAAKLGKEQSYVAKSLKLLSLTSWSRNALRGQLITIDHARLLARLAETEQNEALKWCLDPQAGKKTPVYDVVKDRLKRKNPKEAQAAGTVDNKGDEDSDEDDDLDFDEGTDETGRRSVWNRAWECESVQRLKEHIECSSGEILDRAPWQMDEDWLVPDAGSCLDCPKNTKVNTPLFGDLDMGVAVCTDGACFKAKVEAFVQLQGRDEAKREAIRKGQPPVPRSFEPLRVSWKSTSTAPRMLKLGICMCKNSAKCPHGEGPALTQVFKEGQWVEAKKACEHTRTAVTVDWTDANDRGYGGTPAKLRKPGDVLQVCVAANCKIHPKAWEKAAKANGNGRTEARETDEQREARQARTKIAAKEETTLRIRLASEAIKKITKLPDALLRTMLIDWLPNGGERKALEAACPNVEQTLKTAKLDSLEFGRAVAAASLTGRYLEVWEGWEPKQFRKEFIMELGDLGFDASKAWDKPKAAATKAVAKKVMPAKKAAAKKAVKKAAKKVVKPAKKAVRK